MSDELRLTLRDLPTVARYYDFPFEVCFDEIAIGDESKLLPFTHHSLLSTHHLFLCLIG